MDSRGRIERRKHRRFQVQSIAFAVLRDQGRQLGQIVDISMGGLAFNYIAVGGNADRAFELDILLAYKGLYMKKVQFMTISDFQIANKSPFSPITMRRHGVKFGELMPKQRSIRQRPEEIPRKKKKPLQLSHGGDGAQPVTIRRKEKKIGRNAPCPCGSGKKYKKCCGANK